MKDNVGGALPTATIRRRLSFLTVAPPKNSVAPPESQSHFNRAANSKMPAVIVRKTDCLSSSMSNQKNYFQKFFRFAPFNRAESVVCAADFFGAGIGVRICSG
jgi:hypothetical protein